MSDEEPTLIETFFPFLVVEARDVQFLDKQGKLTSFKRSQKPRSLPFFLHNGEIFIQHCKDVEVKVSFEESLRLCKEHIEENLKDHFERAGEILSKNVYRGPAFCPSCKVRFVFQVRFNNDKIPELLQKLRNDGE